MKNPENLEIHELIKLRRAVEIRIRDAIEQKCTEFTKMTGLYISNVDSYFHSTAMIGKAEKEYSIEFVQCEVDLT